jgi:hypothetical protein
MSVDLPTLPTEHPRASGRPRGLLKRLIGPAALAVSALAFVSSASAAECVNGYRMLGNQVIVLCDEVSDARALYQPGAPLTEAPATTPRQSGSVMVDSAEDCRPGAYWTYYLDSGEVSLACP